jgi:hypothetical protein
MEKCVTAGEIKKKEEKKKRKEKEKSGLTKTLLLQHFSQLCPLSCSKPNNPMQCKASPIPEQ